MNLMKAGVSCKTLLLLSYRSFIDDFCLVSASHIKFEGVFK